MYIIDINEREGIDVNQDGRGLIIRSPYQITSIFYILLRG